MDFNDGVPIKRFLHWGPLLALSIISFISTIGFIAVLIWWPPLDFYGQIHFGLYVTQIPIILYNFARAVLSGPGFVPLGWQPSEKEDRIHLQFCRICQGYKVPRSHHCRKCNRCVLKMDHHCPWINTCCGHKNHVSFIAFLFFVPIGCCHACFVLVCCCYRAIYRSEYHIEIYSKYSPPVAYSLPLFLLMVLSIGLAIGVCLTVGFLFCVQMLSVLRNKTAIEGWICEKSEDLSRDENEHFQYPYDLGSWINLYHFWFYGNGFDWPLAPGASKYDLTIEQIRQKQAKRKRAVEFEIVSEYKGTCFPISFGFRVLRHIPCTDEPRIAVKPGDVILVTRGKPEWLYGEKISSSSRIWPRGWFPRKCAQRTSSIVDFFVEKKDI